MANKRIACIKILQKQAGLNDNQYRALLQEAAGVTSSKELDDRGFTAVRDALRKLANPPRPKTPLEAKAWAIWYDIKPYLAPAAQNSDYLYGIASRVAGRPINDFAQLEKKELVRFTEALKRRLVQERWAVNPINPWRKEVR